MRFLRIRNWERWQSYRSDRGQPPWIKVHRTLMQNAEFAQLSDAEKWHLVAIWILGASNNGRIPDCVKTIKRLCNLDVNPPLDRFLSLQFLEKIGNRRRRKVAEQVVLDTEVDTDTDPPPLDPPPKILDAIPDWLPTEAWDGYEEMRRKTGRQHPWTPRARKLAINALEKLHRAGHDVAAVIDQSVMNGWRGFWPVKGEHGRGNGAHTNGADKQPWQMSDGELLAAAVARGLSTSGKRREDLVRELSA